MSTLTVTFPSDQNFACHSCGKCCRTDWRILVHTSEAKEITKTRSYRTLEREGYQPLKVLHDDYELGRKDDTKACLFLNEKSLCGLHAEAGPQIKPAPCRTFPYQVVNTPSGLYSYLSFSCPSVVFNKGPEVCTSGGDLLATINESPHFFISAEAPSETVQLTANTTVSWHDYLKLESRILKAFRSDQTLQACLIEGITQLFESAPPIVGAMIEHALPSLRNVTIATLEACDDLDRRMEIMTSVSGEVSFHSILLNQAVPGKVDTKLEPEVEDILRRFVCGQLEGKRLITGPNLLVRLLYLLVLTEVFQFYLGAQTGDAQKRSEAVERCFDLLETEALHHFDLMTPILEKWAQDITSFTG